MRVLREFSRRDFIAATAGGVLSAGFHDLTHVSAATPDTIDEVLDIFHLTGPEFGGGLSNHGPMVSEALVTLGRPKEALRWAEKYKARLTAHPDAHDVISSEDWRNVLGDIARLGDWIAFFDRELAEAPWAHVLQLWVPRLAPALMAAATHGTIRTGHAVRSLTKGETPQRLHELAEGLGYWAARYQVLPGRPSAHDAGLTPSNAIREVARINASRPRGLLFEQIKVLNEHSEFIDDIDLVDTDGNLSHFVSNLTETFAGLYLENNNWIAFVHSVTAPSALRLLLSNLNDSDAPLVARYGWQACAALYACFADRPPAPKTDYADPGHDIEALIDMAIADGDEHTIKFTEVCLREYALNKKPVYLIAAHHAVTRQA